MTVARSFVLLVLIACALLVSARPAVAASAEQRQVAWNEKLTEELRKEKPEAVPIFREAIEASERTDPTRAIALLAEVSALAPRFTPAMRRRAVLLAHNGRRLEGIELARQAQALEDTPENAVAVALTLISSDGGAPGEREKSEALGLVRRATDRLPSDPDMQMVRCEVALRAESVSDLDVSAEALLRIAPSEPESHVCATFAAVMRGDRGAAYDSIATARRLGLDPATVDRLTRAVDASEPPLFRWGKRLLAVFALWLVGLAVLFGVGGALSAATLRFVRQLSPDEGATRGGGPLRSLYRAVIHAASLYYYVSLPLVLLLSVLLGGGLILAFFYVGRIPIYLVLVIISIVGFSVVSVVKSIFMRTRDVDPGLSVDLRKHPRLAAVVEEVAARVGTRIVDRVYLTPHTDIAVLERGSMLRQLRGTTERCLVLGVGVLDGMTLRPFKAILAHEYGHFSNRDTAGGGMALSVRRSLLLTAIGLAQRGAAAWYNPAWLFVLGFQRTFLRISQGASRLQEVMADRIAAFAYGPEAFASGLSHVVRRSIEFDAHVNATLGEVVDKSRPLANLYRYEPEEKRAETAIEDSVTSAMEREPSPYDSHPKPVDRVRWVRELATSVAPAEDDGQDVWSLFASREEIEQVMTNEVRAHLAEQGILVRSDATEAA